MATPITSLNCRTTTGDRLARPARRAATMAALLAAAVCTAGSPSASQAQTREHPDLKVWTWADDSFSSEAHPHSARTPFGGGDWVADVAYAEGGVATSDLYVREPGSKSIRCFLNPTTPVPPPEASYEGNFRAEIRRYKWHEPVALGTEEWHGFSYFFPPSYVHDRGTRGVYLQLHAGSQGPPVGLDHYVPADHRGRYGAQLYVQRNWGDYEDKSTSHRAVLPLEFEPGKWYDFVVHVIWDTEAGGRGLTELWINGEKLYSEHGGNTYDAGTDPNDPKLPYGGTLKLGLYKWPWRTTEGIQKSAAAGVTQLEMYIGPVRTIRCAPGEYVGDEGYHLVAPRPVRVEPVSETQP